MVGDLSDIYVWRMYVDQMNVSEDRLYFSRLELKCHMGDDLNETLFKRINFFYFFVKHEKDIINVTAH